jgi:hypothetical protein
MKIRFVPVFLVGLLASCSTAAYEWKAKAYTTDPQNLVTAPLIDAFRFHAEPIATWYLEKLNGSTVGHGRFRVFTRAVLGATFAAFEYTYVKDGVSHTRIYYAMSGRDEPPTDLPASSTPITSYFVEDSTRIRAYVNDSEESLIVSTQTEDDDTGFRHSRDAELKAARTIERDIRRGIVTRDGTLQAYISQPMCDSCVHVMHQLGRLYGVNIHVSYLEQNMSPAYQRFRRMLDGFMNTLPVRFNHAGHGGGPTPPPPPPAATAMCATIFAQ